MMTSPSNSPFSIRPLLDGDVAAETDLIERAFAAGPYGHLRVGDERRAFERDAAGRAASGAVLVAVAGNRLIGTASLRRQPSFDVVFAKIDDATIVSGTLDLLRRFVSDCGERQQRAFSGIRPIGVQARD